MSVITPTTESQEMAILATVLDEVHAEWESVEAEGNKSSVYDTLRLEDLVDQFNLLQEFEYSGPLSLIYHIFYSGMDTEPREELYQRVLNHMEKS